MLRQLRHPFNLYTSSSGRSVRSPQHLCAPPLVGSLLPKQAGCGRAMADKVDAARGEKRRRLEGAALAAALSDGANALTTGATFKVPGLVVYNHYFTVPLDYSGQSGRQCGLQCFNAATLWSGLLIRQGFQASRLAQLDVRCPVHVHLPTAPARVPAPSGG